MDDRPAFDPLLRLKQIIGNAKAGKDPMIPIGRSRAFEGMKDGTFPLPDVRLGPRTIMWRKSTIERFIAYAERATAAAESGRVKSQSTSSVEV